MNDDLVLAMADQINSGTDAAAGTRRRPCGRIDYFGLYLAARSFKAACCVAMSVLLVTPAHAQATANDLGFLIAKEGVPGAAVAACSSCHGAKGEGGPAFPYLGGTGEQYLKAQLDAFANGSRKNSLMQPIARGLSEAQRSAVAVYYSKLAPPARKVARPATDPSRTGEWLAGRGRWKDDLPGCAQCHGPGGAGVGTYIPPLVGLPQAYITSQLLAWKNGSRPAGPLGLMPMVAGKLSESDVLSVSAFYANAGSDATPTPQTAKGRTAK